MSGCAVRGVIMILGIRGFDDCYRALRVCQAPAPEVFSRWVSGEAAKQEVQVSLAAESGKGFVLRVVDVHNLIEAAYGEYFPDRLGKGADGELGLLGSQRFGH